MKLLYIQYANPGAYPPIQHSSRIFARSGTEVLLLGVDFEATSEVRFEGADGVSVKLLRGCKPGLAQKLHYLLFFVWIMWKAVQVRPKWIYVSDPLASPVGLWFTGCTRCKVIYHEHDSPAELHIKRESVSRFMRVILLCRRRLARSAEFCILPNEYRVREFCNSTETKRPVFCVWNCPSVSEFNISLDRKSSGELVVFFHGSITPERLPLTVIRALRQCPKEVRFDFAGYETIDQLGYVQLILEVARECEVSQRVRYIGALPTRRELLQRCAEANVGLALMPMCSEDINMLHMVGASNKPFDYLMCGLALLVSNLPDWKETFVDSKMGRVCDPDDQTSIAAAMRWFLEHPTEQQAMAMRGLRRVEEEWTYERQFAPVLKKMRSIGADEDKNLGK